jgi:dihydrodipicolinate synthase/N-acetylneuraminate lyase
VRLAETAEKAGADAVVAAPPYYFAPGQPELVEYYNHLANRLPLPLFLYNMPSHTKVMIDPYTVRALSENANIVGLKDSSANIVYFNAVRHPQQDNRNKYYVLDQTILEYHFPKRSKMDQNILEKEKENSPDPTQESGDL